MLYPNFRSLLRPSTLIGIAFLILFFGHPPCADAGLLYVLNDEATGSKIYGFQVNETTGALTPLAGFPVNAGNGSAGLVSERMTVDRHNNRLYVINDGSDTVSAFSINVATGALTPMMFSPIALGAGTWNTIAVHPRGSPLIITNNAADGDARSYRITATTSMAATGSPFTVTGAAGFSSAFNASGLYFYVGGNSGSGIAGFSVNEFSGVLTPLAGSPYNAGGSNVLAYATDGFGRLFSVDSSNGVRVFSSLIGVLSPVTNNPFPSGLTQRRHGLVHPNGAFYFVAGNTGNNVGVYAISGFGANTTVSAIANSPFATGGDTANCLAMNRTGQFLFVANRVSRNITTFSVNTSTGQLASLGIQPADTLGASGAINGCAYISPTHPRADFDGDGVTDMSVFRPSEGAWYLNRSTAGLAVQNWGLSGDIPTPGDFDGDEKADTAIFRPSTGTWWILRSSDGGISSTNFGVAGDVPMAGDYDGDFRTDVAVYRPSTGVWYVQGTSSGVTITNWGTTGDVAVTGDYDGNGKNDFGIFRPSTGTWWILNNGGGLFTFTLGISTDRPVPADYDGDNRTDLAVFRPSNGFWYIRNSAIGSFSYIPFGNSTDVPAPGDYDGDGRDDPAVYRNGTWWLNRSTAGVLSLNFGLSTDIPIPAKYIP